MERQRGRRGWDTRGDESLQSGVWSLDSGVWSLESGAWSLESEPGVWDLESGECNLESGVCNLESGVWKLESGVWNLEPGIWSLSLESEIWSLESGFCGLRLAMGDLAGVTQVELNVDCENTCFSPTRLAFGVLTVQNRNRLHSAGEPVPPEPGNRFPQSLYPVPQT